MRLNQLKGIVKKAAGGATVLLLAAGMAHAAQRVNLSAGHTTARLPDGTSVDMWGYTCGSPVSGSTATCAPLNAAAASAGQWSPVAITVPTGQDLEIDLTNNLTFNGNQIPTSLMIVGQIGGGLGGGGTSVASPRHDNRGTTWPIADTGPAFTPPAQGPRVQSFGTEVAAGSAAAPLTWTAPSEGTYLLESGTHPSIQAAMGLVGMVVVTKIPAGGVAGTAYASAGVTYNGEVPLLFSEIDPVQNEAVTAAVNTTGFSESAVRGNFGGPVASVAVTNPGSGYTSAPTVNFNASSADPAVAHADIDMTAGSPTFGQVLDIVVDHPGTYASEVPVTLTGGGGSGALAAAVQADIHNAITCSGGAAACYPPVVNYTPRYFMINGAAFDRTNEAVSLFAATHGTNTGAIAAGGKVLVRMVNAGSRMHIPSIVGSSFTPAGGKQAAGFALIAEDGNVLPGALRVQSEVFMAAGKTYDVKIDVPPAGSKALPVFDRQLSLSANGVNHDAGMLAYIGVNGSGLPVANVGATANADEYDAVVAGQTLAVSDPSKGVIANDINIFGVKVTSGPTKGTLTLNADGTFTYVANAGWSGGDSFTYCGNGATTGAACASVTLGASTVAASDSITLCSGSNCTFNSNIAKFLKVPAPGLLTGATDTKGVQLKVDLTTVSNKCASTPVAPCVIPDENGGFTYYSNGSGAKIFTFQAVNSLGVHSASATATVNFFPASGLNVTVLDGVDKATEITDYRWIIEEDRTFFVDPSCTGNPPAAGCPGSGSGIVPNFGTNFHTSFMPVIASGCTGDESCANGQTVLGATVTPRTPTKPSDVPLCSSVPAGSGTPCLDPNKRYYISVLPGDAAQPFIQGWAGAPDCNGAVGGVCGHGMGGSSIPKGPHNGTQFVLVLTEPSPYPPATLTVFVFEDDYPLNGEHDAGGGIDILSPNEPGLGGFQITLQDDAGGTGDATGTPTYDMFNMPLSNSLAGTIDPVTGFDACPQSKQVTNASTGGDSTQNGVVGMIVTCPTYESDGKTMSPLAGQAVVKNLYQGRYGVVAQPGADRIARGEEWLQTNTLDGQKAHDSFMRIGEPAYFQEFGPAGYHVSIGFANPKIINDRGTALCNAPGADCAHEVKGHVSMARMSRTPDERLYGSGTRDAYGFTQCYVSIGDPEAEEFGLTKCDADGNFDFPKVPAGNWKITTFDQWNDQVVDGITTPVGLCEIGVPNPTCQSVLDMGEVAAHQWQSDIYTRTFIDLNGDGVSDNDASGNPEPGLPLVATNIRFRDGSYSNFNSTDLNGYAGFNEVFPLFNWYVVETDSTRYKNTGVHVVYDAGGPVDGSKPDGMHLCSESGTTTKPCGASSIANNLANTYEPHPLPGDLSLPGSVYCADADCSSEITTGGIAGGPVASDVSKHSTGRIDPPWVDSYGWQGYSGQNNFLEFGKKPFAEGENGGIHGHVVYASTRPFDDPRLLLQLSWEPLVPHVRLNLYKEDVAADGVTPTLTLVDHTETTSFDDWVQGFRTDGKPNISCPGQGDDSTSDPFADPYFFFALKGQSQWLDLYNNNGTPTHTLPYNSQFKCYDGMHNWNQLQPAPYDGMYKFPSVTGINTTTGNTTGTNCTICVKDPDSKDPFRYGKEDMLPDGKYVVEVVLPPGYELVKEEDKNILIGDNFIAPVTQQFAGLGNIFIMPDQAEIAEAYNANNNLNSTDSLGQNPNLPSHEGDTGSVESFWPCVGEERVVPDYISLYPDSLEVAPFAGATRHLCDRKEVTLTDQTAALAKFYIFSDTHKAAHYTGVITDDFSAEFDPYSPQFGEKFAPAYLPVSFKDWAGNEISRVYSDAWGAYNGLNYSTWEVNPPNPTGYGPTMMVGCMNDPEMPDPAHPGQLITDPLYQPGYSDFCYELPFMPGQTGYFDTPVVPTSAFAGGYNTPDCSYPDATPGVKQVTGDVAGPWVSAAGKSLTIASLGSQLVDNYAYSGPQASAAPYNQQKIHRNYGFGSTQGTGSVTIGGVTAPVTGWSDSSITVTVPTGVPDCAVQQQAQFGGSSTQCGELVVTASNGKQSIDTVTVTIGGKAPTVLGPTQTIQSAIDAADPGDLIIVPAGTHQEMVLMWKPIRLQGVGAASSIIDANPHPAGRLDPWRREVVCLFGLALDGQPYTSPTGTHPYDPSGTFTCADGPAMKHLTGGPNYPTMVVDRIPMEGILGWDTTVNGNLAEQLIEPSLLGAYEGAGVTVLGKGVNIPSGAADVWGSGAEAAFPDGTTLLSKTDCGDSGTNLYPSNFYCNPSSIDGLTIKNSSQGGGGILAHGWNHNIQISNNRVLNNQGTMSGGITIGQGEHVDVPLVGGGIDTIPPGSCIPDDGTATTNLALPYCYDMAVNIHNNQVIQNSSLGDELFTSTPAGAGGVTICNGSDYYKFNFNWVCGNMSTGDGAGVAHIGFSYDGDIEHNTILFNQSTNPTISTNGGGLLIMGAPDPDPPCATNDQDCVSPPGSILPSDGAGPGLVINANFISGNSADAGSGGGLRLQHVNGTDVVNFAKGNVAPTWPTQTPQLPFQSKTPWNAVQITNNIISNNVAGLDGGGVSLQDALAVDIVNNTIVSNNSTASAGILFQTLFAPLASVQGKSCTVPGQPQQSCPQPAGLVSVTNSAVLAANLPSGVVCPTNHGTAASSSTSDCRKYSYPILYNNVFWRNRSYMIGVGGLGSNLGNQQNTVTIYDPGFTSSGLSPTPAVPQTATGSCDTAPTGYWDIGIRGDTRPGNHSSGGTLSPASSVLSNGAGALAEGSSTTNLLNPSSVVVSSYCNGSRVPVEAALAGVVYGWEVPPGTNESNALPAPPITMTAAATVDEGNNWINLRWGPLSLVSPVDGTTMLGNFNLAPGSPAMDAVNTSSPGYSYAPPTDFFGHPRPDNGEKLFDIGAIESTDVEGTPSLTSINPASAVKRNTTVAVTLTGAELATTQSVNVDNPGITVQNVVVVNSTTVTASFVIAANTSSSTANVSVTTSVGTSNTVTFTVPIPTLTSVTPNQAIRGTGVDVTFTGTFLQGTTAVNGFASGNVTVSNIVSSPNGTTVTAHFAISVSAVPGAKTLALVTTAGVTNNVTFTVLAPGSTITISPNQGIRGTTVPVTLTGTNFAQTPTPTVGVSGTGVSANSVTWVDSSHVTANLVITSGATASARTLTLTTAGGTSTGTFTVLSPSLTSISPNSGLQGTAFTVSLNGSNFAQTPVPTVSVSGTGVTASNVTWVNSGRVTATFTITGTAAATARTVTLTTAGVASTGTFTVTAPTLTGISPASGSRGSSVPVTFTGTHLTTATGVGGFGAGLSLAAGTFHVVSDSSATATLNITNGATLGTSNLLLTLPGGAQTGTVAFRVTGGTLSFSLITPTLVNGSTSTHSGTMTVTNTATGTNAGPITLTANPALGTTTGPGTFSITGGTCTNGAVIAANGGTCTIVVQYNPNGSTTQSSSSIVLTGTGASTATVTSPTILGN